MQGWVILISLAAGWFYIENEQRQADLADSRLVSCQQNYEGVRLVFKPFLPPPLKKGVEPTPAQQEQADNVELFNDTIDRLIKNCPQQVEGKKTVKRAPVKTVTNERGGKG